MRIAKSMRRVFALALVIALLSGIPALATSYYCNGNRVNMRKGPSTFYKSMGKLKRGEVVTYISQSNGWYKVSYYSQRLNRVVKGYVYRKYLTPVTSGSSKISTSTSYKTTVNLRVRSKPSVTQGYVRTKLKKGTKVTVIKQTRSWVYVTYKGGSGWVSAKYLKKL